MAPKAKAYIAFVVTAGMTAFLSAMTEWSCTDPLRFVSYVAIAVLAAVSKVELPGVNGTLSVYFLFLLIGVLQLSLGETVIIGTAACVVQLLWQYKNRPTLAQIAFNFSSSALAAFFAYQLYWELPMRSAYAGGVSPVKLAFASIVFFLINTGSVAGVIALTENKSVLGVWKDGYLWSFPYYLVGASIAAGYGALSRWVGWEVLILAIPVIYLIFRSYRLYMRKKEADRAHASQMASLHLRTIEALALAIDAKDHTTSDHLQRVQVYALEVGKELNLGQDQMDALQAASLLHDIGKLAVPEHIISKPGKLTPEEFEKMKIHPVVGAEILERVQFPYPVVPIVRSHHEKWDGNGYPSGLKGEEIPIGARILAAVDFLDALASDRPYRRALPLEEAVAKLVAEAGRSFDPQVVDILRRRHKELEHLARTGPKVTNLATLSKDIKIERGEAPAAGFETASVPATPGASLERTADFVSSIAAARQEVQGLFELAQELGSSLSLHDTLAMMAGRLRKMIPYDAVAIYVVRDNLLRAEYFSGDDATLFSSVEIPFGEGISGWVADNRKPILNGSPAVEFAHLKVPSSSTRLNSALSVPLEGCTAVLGALTLYSRHPNGFDRDQLRVLLAVSSKLSVSVENALRFERAESVATTDFLTGLPNARSLFLHLDAEVKRCRRSGQPLAVLVCDLDGFKEVNDRFGHLAGNRLLRMAGNGIRDLCREYDYVARMGGDEFVIVMPGLASAAVRAKAEAFAEAVCEAGQQVCGERLVSLSVGEANFPNDGEDAEQLLAEADRRMYKNKREGKLRRAPRVERLDPASLEHSLAR